VEEARAKNLAWLLSSYRTPSYPPQQLVYALQTLLPVVEARREAGSILVAAAMLAVVLAAVEVVPWEWVVGVDSKIKIEIGSIFS
jgi:hypothetical protein